MTKLLGKIVDSFTMQGTQRVILLDRDCSADLKSGDSVEVNFPSGKTNTVVVLDALLEDGTPYKISGKIASITVENKGFNDESLIGCDVFLVK
ncbi:MAG: hypothetical protein NTZ87_02695 [Candidatus Nomurabacteria bacterium]|nr:hypothetical protein [Candidatus Nomurabacteria bacterium]